MGRVLAVIIWILTLLSVLLFVSGKWWFPDGDFRACSSSRSPVHDHDSGGRYFLHGRPGRPGLDGLEISRHRQGQRSRRLFARQQSSRSALDGDHRCYLYRLGVMGQSVWASLRLHDAPPGSYTVEVVAQQFQWNFHYAGKDNKFGRTDPSSSTTVH